jgi:transposase
LVLRAIDVEHLIAADHPARAIWDFVGQLDLRRYVARVRAVDGAAGRPAVHPHVLVSLWVYSYSRGVSAAREVERLCAHDPAYQWLTGLAGISAHTLSDFRSAHGDALRELFVQVLGLLSAEGLITLTRVMQDGTRVRARASSKSFRRRRRVVEHLALARQTVADLEARAAEDTTSRQAAAQQRAARERAQRLATALEQFAALEAAKSRVDRVSTSDPEARVMKQPDGGAAPSYNVQIATDAGEGLIVDVAVTQAGSDYRQLLPAMDRLEQQWGRAPDQAVVDGGYISSANIVAMATRGIELVGPAPTTDAPTASRRNGYAHRGVHPAYEASRFRYDAATNTYVCPQAQRLRYDAQYAQDGMIRDRYKAAGDVCASCPAKRLCCPRTRGGRSIERQEVRPEVAAFRTKMHTAPARAIYRCRAQVAEFPNLWIKAKLGLRQFRLRGLVKVGAECLWAALTYNIQQWIRLRWRPAQAALRMAS